MDSTFTSPLLDGVPISQMKLNQCCYCSRLLNPISLGERRPMYQATMDHVLPVCRGTYGLSGPTFRNRRPSCARCNGLRAGLGHCTGVLMMALIDAKVRKKDVGEVVRQLRLLTGNRP